MAASGSGAGSHERRNWLVHILYVRREHDACLAVIEEALAEARGLAEYPLYVKVCLPSQVERTARSRAVPPPCCVDVFRHHTHTRVAGPRSLVETLRTTLCLASRP